MLDNKDIVKLELYATVIHGKYFQPLKSHILNAVLDQLHHNVVEEQMYLNHDLCKRNMDFFIKKYMKFSCNKLDKVRCRKKN